MKNILFQGCATALATPFKEKQIHYSELEKLIEFQIEQGIHALVVNGTTGESATLSIEEKKQLIRFTVNLVKHRIPVIAGTGGNNTSEVIELSQYAESIGVDGLLIVTPYYNKTTQKGAIYHYRKIANSVHLPILLYNVPSRTGFNLSAESCYELSKLQNIVGIKEASGNISQVADIASLCDNNFSIYSGNDDLILPILSLGGRGIISVLSNIAPSQTISIVNHYFQHNLEIATSLQLKAIPLIRALFSEVNPIPIKFALNLMGYDFGTPRLPLIELSKQKQEHLEQQMKKYGLLIS